MSELSPAAQAVLTAYNQRELAAKRTTALAAALRAVVNLLAYEAQLCDPMMTSLYVVDADDLDAIAAELEAQ